MGDFETLNFSGHFAKDFAKDIARDFRQLLAEFKIPTETYQRLELVFRQVLSLCPATQYEFTQDANEEFGFGACTVRVVRGRAKARDLYRQALTSFHSLFEDPSLSGERQSLEDQWLRNLAHTLRFHISLDSVVQSNASDEHACYLAISEAIYRPFFESHFKNRQHTSERYHEFISLKRMMESGSFLSFNKLEKSVLPVGAVLREVDRMNLLPANWIAEVASDRDESAA
jgi:hypothetical protein